MITGGQLAAGTAHLGTPARHHNGGIASRLDPLAATRFSSLYGIGALFRSLLGDGNKGLAGLSVKEAVDTPAIDSLSGQQALQLATSRKRPNSGGYV